MVISKPAPLSGPSPPVVSHGLVISRQPYFSTPMVYTVICVCGQYDSGKRATDRDAWLSGVQHLKSKSTE